jgi:hypothetical protein
MARKPKPHPKPRHRVRWPAEQWGADARVEIDVFVRQDNKPVEPPKTPKNDPDKIPTRITDHRTGEVTETNTEPQTAPPKDWQTPTQESVNESMARLREAMQATVSPLDERPPDADQPADPVLTQPEIQALTQPKADDESWFEAIDAVCEKIGVYGACRWFLGAVGAGAGGATVVWAVSKMLQK